MSYGHLRVIGNSDQGTLVFFLFDLLFLDGENLMPLPLVDRKARLASASSWRR
jgi:ATP-dependent DNA ligase